jgi:hypothetical protein
MKNKKIGVLREYKIEVRDAFLLIIIVLFLFTLYLIFPNYRSELTYLSSLMGGAAIIYTAYYAYMTLKLTILHNKQYRSFELLNTIASKDITRVRLFIMEEISDIKPSELYEKIKGNKELFNDVTVILGLFEDLSVAIQEDFVDELILKKSLNFLVIWFYDNLDQFIEDVRKHFRRKALYCEYEKLRNAWKEDKSLLTGKNLTIETSRTNF